MFFPVTFTASRSLAFKTLSIGLSKLNIAVQFRASHNMEHEQVSELFFGHFVCGVFQFLVAGSKQSHVLGFLDRIRQLGFVQGRQKRR